MSLLESSERQKKEREYLLLRELRIREARKSLWAFCKLLEPDFYKEDRWHLIKLCNDLQALYEGTLINPTNNKPYKKLMLNIPPRHGKSRTLVNFCRWVLGRSEKNRIITASYNDDQASEFSRFTRDGIREEKTFGYEVIYNDIFPNTKIKKDNSSFEKWALEGEFFNYKGSGVGGSITGKGCNIAITDDLIKDAETAYNESALDKIWLWYTGTFLSRKETGSIEIMNMTRWSKKDPCGRVLNSKAGNDWYVLKLEAYNEIQGMLCPFLLSLDEYNFLSDPENFDNAIFRANYHQEPLDIKGKLYNLATYDYLPSNIDRIIAFIDTADQGNDFLSMPVGAVVGEFIYIIDWVYTKEPFEVSENLVVECLQRNNVDICKVESNSGGRQFARNIERLLQENKVNTYIEWFAQTSNKMGRILTHSSNINAKVLLPKSFYHTHREVYNALNDFQKEGKNKNDDAPDSLTGLYEMINEQGMADWNY